MNKLKYSWPNILTQASLKRNKLLSSINFLTSWTFEFTRRCGKIIYGSMRSIRV